MMCCLCIVPAFIVGVLTGAWLEGHGRNEIEKERVKKMYPWSTVVDIPYTRKALCA